MSAAGNSAQNGAAAAAEPLRLGEQGAEPAAGRTAQSRRSAPPPSSSGADQLSSSLMPSVPLRITATWISQKTRNAMATWPGTAAQPGQAASSSASSASPPIQVWIPNQPQATIARSIAGRLAPRTPKLARQSTGKEMPYLVPACALSTIGTSTMVLPSRMVTIACHQLIPCCMSPEASV